MEVEEGPEEVVRVEEEEVKLLAVLTEFVCDCGLYVVQELGLDAEDEMSLNFQEVTTSCPP